MATIPTKPGERQDNLPSPNWREIPATVEEASQKEFEKDSYLLTRPELRPEALHGILDPIVKLACRNTEAVPATVAMHLLTRFGAIIGRSAHLQIGNQTRYLNTFSLIVGPTSKGRKGTSAELPSLLFRFAERGWWPLRELTALSTGEGLINQVRDPRYSDDGSKVVDKGVTDKRLLCDVSEFGGVLTVAARKENTLTAVVRDAFDGRTLTTPSKTSYQSATAAHVAIVGSIPEAELLKSLTQVDIVSGFANRFGMFYSTRMKIVADPRPAPIEAIEFFANHLRGAIGKAAGHGAVPMDDDATQYWEEMYEHLNEQTHEPIVAKLLAREELYTRIWAAQIALINQEGTITRAHLDAALAWRDYWEDTLNFVFSTSDRNENMKAMRILMDRIVELISALGGKQVRHSDVTKRLTNNYARNSPIKKDHVKAALELLQRESPPRIIAETLSTDERGRPANVYTMAYFVRQP